METDYRFSIKQVIVLLQSVKRLSIICKWRQSYRDDKDIGLLST